jgi:hypothetical protein
VARELLVVDSLPDADDVARVHAEDELRERCLDEPGHRRVRATVVRLAPAHEAARRGHLHHHGVALDRGADAERHAVLGRHGKRGGKRLDISDLQVGGHPRLPG